ncbi:MAG: hypothetical protein NC122_08655 [Faecalibacterium sp.]|nr:hypothetical protein [Ruminococcus sp.]MCM1392380.1 hypothetical protein [Ruminococcus sp.]MCM1486264.1 hypothetical protein [Faecalibacterium sp.]
MKKIISVLLTLLTIISCVCSFTANAATDDKDNVAFTNEYFESLNHVYAEDIQPMATGLITAKRFGIAKDGTKLVMTGHTICSNEVVKCGFSKIVIERKLASETKWSTYTTYKDLCASSNIYNLSKSITVEKGYQYRATATHYAKKSLLSTQKITSSTGSLTF